MILDCAGKPLDLSQPRVMGILNVTPDSFSDGGRFFGRDQAVEQALRMQEEGAAIIDIGGESTRPGAGDVSVEQELERVLPLVEALAPVLEVPISVDTSKPEVMQAAVAAGAGMINDVYALRRDGALATAAALAVPVCLMHMQGEPRSMQQAPEYTDVVAEVRGFLLEQVYRCEAAGILRQRLLIDPGFGFGKSLAHNLGLLKHLPELVAEGMPVLVGMSRKSMIGAVLDVPLEARLHGSVAAATLAAWMGAKVIRVHDVRETVEAMKMVAAVMEGERFKVNVTK
jgi:dihydropteroate synthase